MTTSGVARLRVGFAQTRPAFGDVTGNLAGAAQLVERAPDFDVLVLPELFATGYLFLDRAEAERVAEGTDGPTAALLRELAARRRAWIVGGFAERADGRLFNSAALAGPDGALLVYRKVHLFDRETEVFDPGDRPFRAWTLEHGGRRVRVGVMICFDWLFPEAARCLAVDGAELLLHPSNLVLPFCQDAMRTRCLENRVFAITANRCGDDVRASDDVRRAEKLHFTGASQITGPRGQVIARAEEDGECVSVVEIDLAAARDKQVTPRNDLLGSRRPAAYGRLVAPSSGEPSAGC
ncbi:MAG: nitrilase-related carbon-nitrogen hydrolase [bacterium]